MHSANAPMESKEAPRVAEPWAPSLVEVGSRIPSKTRDQSVPGSSELLGTFDSRTSPTDVMVAPIVTGAVAVVASAIGMIGPALYPLALDAAAWRAAADIELAYPERRGDVEDLYPELDKRARLALERLREAADDSGSGTDASLPVWSMLPPPPWGDENL